MPYFEYNELETSYLRQRDPILGKAIDQIGPIQREVIPDLFEALVHSIVGQQISSKAHQTVWNRIKSQLGTLTPELVAALGEEEIQRFGISMRKAEYICQAAREVLDGGLPIGRLAQMDDDEVCRELSRLSGVGVWTAEMLMIFSMQRKDILSFGDFGIQRGLRMLYHHRKITPALYRTYKRRYSPYATVASLYLWAVAAGAIEGLRDPGAVKKPAKPK